MLILGFSFLRCVHFNISGSRGEPWCSFGDVQSWINLWWFFLSKLKGEKSKRRLRTHSHTTNDWEESSESEIPEGGKSQVILIDDSAGKHVAQAICDPYKGDRPHGCLQGAGSEGNKKGKRDPGRMRGFYLILVNLKPFLSTEISSQLNGI